MSGEVVESVPGIKVLSMGWGVQTFTLAAMCALGEFEKPDFGVFSDTTWESEATYKFIKKWGKWLAKRGVTIHHTSAVESGRNEIEDSRGPLMPLFAVDGTGRKFVLTRRCTDDWKITPVYRFIHDEVNRRGLGFRDGVVEMWIGISYDEAERMKPARAKYIRNRWPLIELKMTRGDCVHWLRDHGLDVPPKSSCVFCPYRANRSWQELLDTSKSDFEFACGLDDNLRNKYEGKTVYMHNKLVPLREARLRRIKDERQIEFDLFAFDNFSEECEGHCGV